MPSIVIGYKFNKEFRKIETKIYAPSPGFTRIAYSTLMALYEADRENETFILSVPIYDLQDIFRNDKAIESPVIKRRGFSGVESEYDLSTLENEEFIVLHTGGQIYKGRYRLKIKVRVKYFNEFQSYDMMIEDILLLTKLKSKKIEVGDSVRARVCLELGFLEGEEGHVLQIEEDKALVEFLLLGSKIKKWIPYQNLIKL